MMKIFFNFLNKRPLLQFFKLFIHNRSSLKNINDNKDLYNRFKKNNKIKTKALDLGSGHEPSNNFFADNVYGLDIIASDNKRVKKCFLGFEKLPYKDNTFDYITAYDVLEHIPRFSYSIDSPNNNLPFIYLMNEIYRVLKKDGIFLSKTPIYPFAAAFVDPTHNNFMTYETMNLYFTKNRLNVSRSYGVTSDFIVLDQGLDGQHLIAIFSK